MRSITDTRCIHMQVYLEGWYQPLRLGAESAEGHVEAAQLTIRIYDFWVQNLRKHNNYVRVAQVAMGALLCLVCVSEAGRLQHTGADALIVDPVRHSSDHVWQQCSCAMNELAELVYLRHHASGCRLPLYNCMCFDRWDPRSGCGALWLEAINNVLYRGCYM